MEILKGLAVFIQNQCQSTEFKRKPPSSSKIFPALALVGPLVPQQGLSPRPLHRASPTWRLPRPPYSRRTAAQTSVPGLSWQLATSQANQHLPAEPGKQTVRLIRCWEAPRALAKLALDRAGSLPAEGDIPTPPRAAAMGRKALLVCSIHAFHQVMLWGAGSGIATCLLRSDKQPRTGLAQRRSLISSAAELLCWEEEPPKLGCGPVCTLLLVERGLPPFEFQNTQSTLLSPQDLPHLHACQCCS